MPRQIAGRAQLLHQTLERDVLVGQGTDDRLPGPMEELPEGRSAVEVDAQGQGIDEETHDVPEIGLVTTGHGGAQHDVVFTRVQAEECRHAAYQDHEGGEAQLPCSP